MQQYILRRLLLFVPTLVLVSVMIFAMLRIVPGDPVLLILAGPDNEGSFTVEEYEAMREQLGFNDPIYVQYFKWSYGMVTLDWGRSLETNERVSDIFKRRYPVTLQLALLSFFVIATIGIPIGVLAAVKQDTWTDYIFRGFAILGLAMPTFWLALLILLALSLWFNWIPPLEFVNLWEDPRTSITQLIFPALALGLSAQGTTMRMTRSQLLEVMREDYVRTARAKGLREQMVIWRHALKNAILPVLTLIGIELLVLFSGVVIVETLFIIPGVGKLLVDSLFRRDYIIVQGLIFVFAIFVLIVNLAVDLSYAFFDPRIRLR
jgi:peptide/nickel transport system permease protein